MSKPVARNVVMYQADDESLHPTEAAAQAHNAYIKLTELEAAVADIFRKDVQNHHFSWLSREEGITPYNRNDAWGGEISYEREEFIRQLVALVLDHLDEVVKAVAESKG